MLEHMKGFALGLSLSLAFILGCVAAPALVPHLDAQPTSAQPAPPNAPRWEMQCADYEHMNSAASLTRLGDQAGANGWELAWVVENRAVVCFKRPRG